MKIKFLVIGKTTPDYFSAAYAEYATRLIHYTRFSTEHVPDVKSAGNMAPEKLKDLEGQAFMKRISSNDYVVLLDDKGKEYTSEGMAKLIEKLEMQQQKQIVFIAGGAFGFSEELYQRANHQLSLSKMTFSHQMVRLIFAEQLYRAFTIIKGESYHHK